MQVDLMDKISVVIRNRNESEYIGFAIQSVIDNFKDPEILSNQKIKMTKLVILQFQHQLSCHNQRNSKHSPVLLLKFIFDKAFR